VNDDVNDAGFGPKWKPRMVGSTLELSPGQIVFGGADGLMRFKFLLSGQVHVMAPKIVPQKKLILVFLFFPPFFAKFVNALFVPRGNCVVGVC